MPRAYYDSLDDVDVGQKAMEIIGRGPEARKSKTYMSDEYMAFICTKIRAKRRMWLDALRVAHANWHTRPIITEDENGDQFEDGEEPEVLEDEEIIAQYKTPRFYDNLLQEFVELMTSYQGLSIKATTSYEDEKQSRRSESSNRDEATTPAKSRW